MTTGSATVPEPGPDEDASAAEPARIGPGELGRISVADVVVQRIAARAAAEHPDAGAAVTRVLGIALPGAGHLGTRSTDLDGLPKSSVIVDGTKAFVTLEISVRWPLPVPTVAGEVRRLVADRVAELTGLVVEEVHITVSDLVTEIAAPPRVR